MGLGQWVLLIYAVLMIAGGAMGSRAGSKVSLYAGVGSGLVLLAAFGATFAALETGLWIGCGLAAALAVVFGKRLAKTGKFMPAGMLL
ncbi:MAG: hypothetical protein GTN89_12565, partial [Acidobacteria bacterium]|nr:hypothetical protein [Acidobacteriota bacterium]NIM63715.1 hypothetical protein [Acidobacteriota bacterium]NIO60100.1 hypothetical protein [Acidobacteriota bacterium]NIQ31171.1 hypothetical protein [Acidobacteriota bacterium]NIQ86300.1 hypothetical protein [Acidobacteriota bacterium]